MDNNVYMPYIALQGRQKCLHDILAVHNIISTEITKNKNIILNQNLCGAMNILTVDIQSSCFQYTWVLDPAPFLPHVLTWSQKMFEWDGFLKNITEHPTYVLT